ncbi:hypothetical protein DXA62_08480 [Coprobacillus sp. OF03-2AA]|uniref:hypothetical protein n=1 Tax=Faecalibacillus intestinalis TaxID=1982626 RepID=UPI000E4E3395|nr:hypothetical protein [Faecalibacillus intestinalis]RHP73590.1 hypothetical protein DXA62_08480 [Coprobacillus sp. OF03-2AA]
MKLQTKKLKKTNNSTDVTQEYLAAVIAITADISLYLKGDVDDSQLLDVLKKNVFKKDFKKIEKLEDLLRHGDGKIIANR